MDLYSLLDKNDQTQIAILRFMLDQNMTARVSEIQETLSISPFIFETNIEELMETLDHLKLGISINYDQETEWLELQKVGNADLSKLKYHYLRKSLNYQLLVYLYEHPSFSITKLASHLALGEAAVYRRISKLNKMLKEFEISIKRGQMVGSELQTCYFFFRLFWTAVPLEEIRETTNDHNSLSFVAYLEKHFGQALNSTAKIKLFLWIRILKIRLSRHDKNLLQADSIITDFPVQQKNDPLYRVICDAYFLSMGHFATFAADFKLISLYLFISSVFILSPDNIFLATAGKRPTYNDKIR